MYAFIRGEVIEVLADRTVVEACGVGYELYCSGKTLSALQKGRQAKLLTHLHIVEGAMALYGFHDDSERDMFRRLLLVTRVGPKLALAVLSMLTPADVAAAIITDNADALSCVPGLGKKTAQRVLLELKEKVSTTQLAPGMHAPAGEGFDLRTQAIQALIGLGYDGASAQRAVLSVENAETIETLLTQALRLLAKQ